MLNRAANDTVTTRNVNSPLGIGRREEILNGRHEADGYAEREVALA
jgi:hypothetical protein